MGLRNRRVVMAMAGCLGLLACGRTKAAFAEGPYTVCQAGAYKLLVADTRAKAEQGLMHVSRIPAFQGMVFVQEASAPAVFWMKGCRIPMDMVFIAPDGTVQRVLTAKVVPGASDRLLPLYTALGEFQRSQLPIGSLPPTAFVVEVAEGRGVDFARGWNPAMLPEFSHARGVAVGFTGG